MNIVTVETMKKLDNYCINNLKIPGIVLMENAALKVIKNIDISNYNSFCIFCAKGNNGGDGFAVARHLYNIGKNINVFLVGSESNMSEDCKINYNILKNLGIKVNIINTESQIPVVNNIIKSSDMTIDAIFGTGLSRNIEGIYAQVIKSINANSKYTLSIDIPSGLSGNTGDVLKNCINADKTISFQLYKKGFFKYGADKFLGNLSIENIGIPKSIIKKFDTGEFILSKSKIRSVFKKRNKYAHKGNFGRVLIIAGSKGFSGAAYISTESAVKSGAGLVTLACRENIQDIMSSKLVEAMTLRLEETKKLANSIEKSDSIGIGPGMGNNDVTLSILKEVIDKCRNVVVIDADGINVLSNNLDLLKNKKCNVIITPHPGEMSRITGLSVGEIENNRVDVAKKFAREYGVILVLKGYNTVITDGFFTAINSTGNSAMASGGMGDCLTGIITSLAAQGYKAFEAACIGVYIHGLCGDILSRDMFCVSASDIMNKIPYVLKDVLL